MVNCTTSLGVKTLSAGQTFEVIVMGEGLVPVLAMLREDQVMRISDEFA